MGEGGTQAAAQRQQKMFRNSTAWQAAKVDTTLLCAPQAASFSIAALTLLTTASGCSGKGAVQKKLLGSSLS